MAESRDSFAHMFDDPDRFPPPTLKRGEPVSLDIYWNPPLPAPFIEVLSVCVSGPADHPFLQQLQNAHQQGKTVYIIVERNGEGMRAEAYVTHLTEQQEPDGTIAYEMDLGVVDIIACPPET